MRLTLVEKKEIWSILLFNYCPDTVILFLSIYATRDELL